MNDIQFLKNGKYLFGGESGIWKLQGYSLALIPRICSKCPNMTESDSYLGNEQTIVQFKDSDHFTTIRSYKGKEICLLFTRVTAIK